MNEIASPLLDIVRRAARSDVVGPAARIEKRFWQATDVTCVVLDCSGSMLDLVGSSGLSKFRHLQIALEDLMQGFPKVRLVAFASRTKVVARPSELPQPESSAIGSGTNLAAALDTVAGWNPRKTIIVSDGLPASEIEALQAAERMTGSIDTIYCGPDDHPACQFLASLARSTGGRPVVWAGRHEISGVIRALLPAPE